jgi:hypothetical protein
MWFSRRAIGLHVLILIIVPTFIALCIWQLHRALSGNELSWAYVFEWPFFAGYAIYMWWRFVHDVTPDVSAPDQPVPAAPAASPADESARDAEAAELAAYNQYLAALAERDKRKQSR